MTDISFLYKHRRCKRNFLTLAAKQGSFLPPVLKIYMKLITQKDGETTYMAQRQVSCPVDPPVVIIVSPLDSVSTGAWNEIKLNYQACPK